MSSGSGNTGRALELIKRSDILPDVLQKKAIITRPLQKKDELTVRETAWTYNAPLTLVASMGAIGMTAAAETTLPAALTPNVITVSALAIEGIAVLYTTILTCWRLSAECRSSNKSMTYQQRKQNMFYEHARKNARHSKKRGVRYKGIKYDQYSVWPTYGKGSVMLNILQHVPWTRRKFMGSVFTKEGITASKQFDRETGESQHEFLDRILDGREDMEDMAEALEEEAYQKSIEELETKRVALGVRR